MSSPSALRDRFGRAHTYLRVSVTDRCNFRCVYCLPAEGMDWMRRDDLLSYEEITRLVSVFASLGIRRVRLTGGEPLIRRDLERLVEGIGGIEGIDDIAMTTNAHRLEGCADRLAEAGLTRLNVSIDSIDPDQFAEITRGGTLDRVLRGMDAAIDAGIGPIKLNMVVLKGVNEDQIIPMVEHFGARPETFVLRFIEYMPFEARWHKSVKGETIRDLLGERYGIEPDGAWQGDGPAVNHRLGFGLRVGFINPLSERFCSTCNRLRLSADGFLRTCLSDDGTPSLAEGMRDGATDEDIAAAIREMVLGKREGHDALLDGGKAFEGVMTRIGG
ncbi:MAG: GTP 3',8-cyclase MoaA [Proteobacteria bacterium]|nr:GTP 3',8-cyclase MoaA [Pseudomonadota bacterium]MCP4916494.1 GTP 3',8-cyclase MoaA [Pseudomonadota bacterium]